MTSFLIGSVVLNAEGVATTKTGMAGELYDAFVNNVLADFGVAVPTGADGLAMKQNLAMLGNHIATGAGGHIINNPPAASSILVKIGNTPQTGVSTTYTKVQEWTQDGPIVGDITPGYATDRITIVEPGIYQINFNISFEGTILTQYVFATYIDNAFDGDLLCRVDTTALVGQVVSAGFSGLYQLDAGAVLDVRVQANGASKTIITRDAGLSVNLIQRDPV